MEQQLIVQAQAGSRAAFDELIKLYSRRIYCAAYSFLHNVDDAADIVQEVFSRAYKNFSSFDATRALFPWLYRITRNLCINMVRKAGRHEAALPVDDLLPSVTLNPEQRYLRNEESESIKKAIASLSGNYQEILILKHFQNCSYAEMAEILSIPIGTVMSRLYTARSALRAKLQEVWE